MLQCPGVAGPGEPSPLLRWLDLSVSTIAICIVVVIASLGNNIVSPVLPAIRDFFGSSAADVSLIASGFGLGRLAMDLPAGLLTDRVGATKLFAAGIVISGAAAAAAAFAANLHLLILARIAMGFGSAIMTTVGLVMLVNTARPDQRGTVLAFYTSAMLFGSAVSPIIGGYLATLFSWRAVFLFCAFTPFISLPLNLLMTGRATSNLESRGDHRKSAAQAKGSSATSGTLGEPRANWPALITVYTATFLTFFNRQGMQNALLPLYAGSVLGMDPTAIGGVLSSRAIFTMLIMLPAGAIADRIGRKQLLVPGMLLLVVGNLYLLTGESVFIFTASTFLISAGVLGNNMLSALVADLIPERLVGRGMGMYRFTCDLGTVAGPVALGLIVDHFSFNDASIAGAGVVLVGVVGCILLIPRRTGAAAARHIA